MRFTGIVQDGLQRARLLGFPTINIPLDRGDVDGIFAAKVTLGEEVFAAAAFADPQRHILEAHIFDFDRVEIGKEATIELFEKVRDRAIFHDDEQLKQAIATDVAAVRQYFHL